MIVKRKTLKKKPSNNKGRRNFEKSKAKVLTRRN